MKSRLQRHTFIRFAHRALAPSARQPFAAQPCPPSGQPHLKGRHSTSLRGIPTSFQPEDQIVYTGIKKHQAVHAQKSVHLKSSLSYPLLAVAVLSLISILAHIGFQEPDHTPTENSNDPPDSPPPEMAPQLLPGRPGNLTPDQEEKLRKLWLLVLQLCGTAENNETSSADASTAQEQSPNSGGKKQRFGMFRKNRGDSKSGSADAPSTADTIAKNGAADDDKYGQTKQFQEMIANNTPEAIRETLWSMVKHDHPDALLLRFLRARKWDVEKALVMAVSTLNWRHNEMLVDAEIMKNGEGGAHEDEKAEDARAQRLGKDFMAQIRMGKSFLHGTDKNGRPICVVRVRLHKQGEQCEESLEKYTVYIIETTRMLLAPPVDTATIIFDMTGFSMANMDYTPVKFMIKCFEANYPESLGAVLVHNSPWIFQGIWRVIRGWLDPVVAGKVHFTNNKAELAEFIEPGQILKELGGDEDWEYKYVEPVPGENDMMKDTAAKERLLVARAEVVKKFEAATLDWINQPEGDEGKSNKAKRDEIAAELREGYWTLDPYLRSRSLYDRIGVIQPGGKITWDATRAPAPKAQPPPETSANDLD